MPPGFALSTDGVPRVRGGGRARGPDRGRDGARLARRRRRDRRRVARDQRGDAVRAGARCGARRDRAALRRRSAATRRRWRCARARSARTARTRRSPASRRRTCGCAGSTHVCDAVRDCWVSLYSAPAISYRARLGERRGAGDGGDRAADGRRRGLRRDVHLQPGQRRPEHGRDQRQLGARPGGRRRRGDARRLPRSARSRARSCASTISDKHVEYVPDAGGGGAVRVAVPDERRERRCLDQRRQLARAGRRRAARRAPLRLATRTSSGRSRRDGELFVVQSRPVTAVRQRSRAEARAGIGDVADHEHVRRRAAGGLTMALTDDDVREILRIIDESELDELRIETEGFSLHVRAGRGARRRGRARARRPRDAAPGTREPTGTRVRAHRATAARTIPRRCSGPSTAPRRPGEPPFVEVGSAGRARHDRLHHRGDEDDELGPAGVAGTIVEVVRGERASWSSTAQPLFRVQPA